MRVLHLTPELPFAPGGGGGQTHEFAMLTRLVALGHDVLNVSPAEPAWMRHTDALRREGVGSWVAPRPASQLEEVVRATARDPGLLGYGVVAPLRALEMAVFWRRLRPLALQAVDEFRPDVVVVGHDMAAAWALDLPAALPAVLTLHNLTWRWYESRARLERGVRALAMRTEAARYRRFVLGTLPRYSLALAISAVEADEIEPHVPVAVVPTGVSLPSVAPVPHGPPRVLFTGKMSYEPNAQGIAWFASDVWPAVRAAVADAELMVVGKEPPAALLELDGRDGISVTGFVESMEPHFAAASCVVAPILTGAGIRVKIVEALGHGRAIVSTSLGCEGLVGLEPGRDLLVADSAADFAAAVVSVLRDGALRDRLASSARALAEREYDLEALGRRLEAALARV